MAASSESDEETFLKVSVIRGHHVYKLNWTPIVGQNIEVHAEHDNIRDPRAVAPYLDANIGHLPIEFSKTAWYFLQHGGTISCVVTGTRKYLTKV